MASFEIILWIYDLSLRLMVTPIDDESCRFKIETTCCRADVMILNYLPDHSWNAEKVTMKFFTKAYIHQLGKLIEMERPGLF